MYRAGIVFIDGVTLMSSRLNERWWLPDGVDELLPPDAFVLEKYRRLALDLFHTWGYELVFPPMMEYLDSLMSGSGEDLLHQTFKVTDPVSGRLLGVRADITPQVARIDAHRLRREGAQRYCYCGTVVRANPENLLKDRAQVQIGAELFGSLALESDAEVMELLCVLLGRLPLTNITFVIGHAGLYHELMNVLPLNAEQQAVLTQCLQHKSMPDLVDFLSNVSLSEASQRLLLSMSQLYGDASVLSSKSGFCWYSCHVKKSN
jgi:ATP phosphoribosyltransferase regulatory subunit